MDGLLLDTEKEWVKIERNFTKDHGIILSGEMQNATLGLRTIEVIKYWYNYKPWPNPDFHKTETEIEEYMRLYYIHSAPLMEGALEILNYFKQKKVRMALASSSTMKLIDTFIKKYNLDGYFEVKHSAETENFGKPHPGVYITTAQMLGLHPSSCLAIEDSFNGVLAAKSAMMKAVAVPDNEHFNDPRFVIADMKLRSLEEFGDKQFNELKIENGR